MKWQTTNFQLNSMLFHFSANTSNMFTRTRFFSGSNKLASGKIFSVWIQWESVCISETNNYSNWFLFLNVRSVPNPNFVALFGIPKSGRFYWLGNTFVSVSVGPRSGQTQTKENFGPKTEEWGSVGAGWAGPGTSSGAMPLNVQISRSRLCQAGGRHCLIPDDQTLASHQNLANNIYLHIY